MEIIFSIITSFLFFFSAYFVGIIIFKEKIKWDKRMIKLLFLYTTLIFIIIFFLKSSLSTFLLFFIFVPLYRMLFHKNQLMNVLLSFTILTIYFFIQMIYLKISDVSIASNIYQNYNRNMFVTNLFFIGTTIIVINSIKNKIKKTLHKIKEDRYYTVISLFTILLSIIFLYFYQYSFRLVEIQTTDLLLFVIIILSLTYSIDRDNRLDNVTKDYNEVSQYSKLHEELNIHYRMRVHENKNQLLIIRGLIDGKKSDLEQYVDCLLDDHKKVVKNYWLNDLSHIPFPGVKNFLNEKLLKLNSIGANIEVYVSNDLESISVDNLDKSKYKDFSTVLGVVLDNMIDCVKDQEKKLIGIHFFIENNEMHGEFVNNFHGTIDLEKISIDGYSTKGIHRGVGLSLVNEIISNNNFIDCRPKIIDEFFIQDVTLKLDNIPKTTK